MDINWKLRLKNKATLAALLSAVVVFAYSALGAFGVTPAVGQESVMSGIAALLSVLTALGVLVDPTTNGVSDSDRAMEYDEPN